jgi:hypothetical protein
MAYMGRFQPSQSQIASRVVKKLPCLAATAFGDKYAQLKGAET